MAYLEKLSADKRLVARIYARWASRFAGYKDFWQALARDESGHAELIQKHRRGPMAGAPEDHRKAAVWNPLNRLLDNELKTADEPRLSLLHAFSAAFEIEEMLIQTLSLEATGEKDPVRKSILLRMRNSDSVHLEQLRLSLAKF